MTNKQIGRTVRTLAMASLVLLSACNDNEPGSGTDLVGPVLSEPGLPELSVAVSSEAAAVGERITVAVAADSDTELSGVQGYLNFDPSDLSFVGQVPDDEAIVVINESEAELGRIRLASISGTALTDRIAKFAFEVNDESYTDGLGFEPEVVGDLEQNELPVSVAHDVSVDEGLPSAANAVNWSYLDWAVYADPSVEREVEAAKAAAGGPAGIPGLPVEGTAYGDVNLSGGSFPINVIDASQTSNTSVGNLEVIIGTDSPAVDRVTAANVRPLAGTCPVGASGTDCATRIVNVLDASAIAQEAVGNDQPVVGEPIDLPKDTYASGDTVFHAGQTISGTETWTADKIHILTGIVVVGDEAGAAGELVLEPGTRVEGELNSAIFITRNGRIDADGTLTQPITFTCRAVPPAVRAPGCWGGVFIAGNAVVNEQDAGLGGAMAPAIPGRNPTGGQNQREGEGGAVNYGGGNDADNSGTIRYARFMYGGKDLGNNNELNNLTIGACGTGTTLEHIQVHAGEDDGLEFFGGRCGVKYLYATANDDDQLDYSFGFDGDIQFVILQHCRVAINDCDTNFEVDNTETPTTYDNLPRTNPRIYNVTSVGGDQGTGTKHVNYRRGAGGTIRNVIMIEGSTGFDIDNSETCDPLSWESTVVMSVTTLLDSGVCSPEPIVDGTTVHVKAYSPGTAGSALKDPFDVILPDFRPLGSGITSSAPAVQPVTPPAGFDTSATYFGAVPPIGLSPNAVAWYMGWVEPWQGPTTR